MATAKKSAKKSPKAKEPQPPEENALEIQDAKAEGDKEERGRFILEKNLGRGGVCEVYEALDLLRASLSDAHPKVAIKKLRVEFKEDAAAQLALAREFIKTRALSHPGVIEVFDLHRHEGELCLSMELVEAPTLKERLRQGPEIPAPEARRMAGKIFEAISHIHQRGLAHADLKPGNIFLKSGQPVIFDFNASVALPGAGQAAELKALVESKNFPAATVVYAAPERLEGAPPSPAGDVFSAAVTVYEMLSGRHPFGRRSAVEAAGEGVAAARPQVLGRRHWRYLEAALSFEPEKRPTASEMARIYAALDEKPTGALLLANDLRHLALDVHTRVTRKLKNFRNQDEVKNGPA